MHWKKRTESKNISAHDFIEAHNFAEAPEFAETYEFMQAVFYRSK